MSLEEILHDLEAKLTDVETEMSLPETLGNQNKMTELAREHKRLTQLVDLNNRYNSLKEDITDLTEALEDPELSELAEVELPEKSTEIEKLEAEIKRNLLPEEPENLRNAVLEIRAGTGGLEAALFGMDLYKMYSRYIESQGWTKKVLNGHFSDLGGVKELIIAVNGAGSYGRLRYESGVHRVQRVPQTETSGRLHTSAATVAIMPEAEDVDIEIDPNDLKIDTYRSSGPGGQHVNKTDSAIRITHFPSGLVVTCQDEKSQHKNKLQAMKVLRSRLYKAVLEKEKNKRAEERRSQVSSGDRSAKIRTYNFPQGRITDHRVPISVFRLEEVLTGDLDILLSPLADHFFEERLKQELGNV